MATTLQMLVSALVSAVVFIIFEERITLALLRLTGGRFGTRPQGSLKGDWYSIFWYRSAEGAVDRVETVVAIRKVGSRLSFVAEGPNHKYQVLARLNSGSVVTGSWSNQRGPSLYEGACQFLAEPEGDALVGQWVGWNKGRRVAGGPWLLVRGPHPSVRARERGSSKLGSVEARLASLQQNELVALRVGQITRRMSRGSTGVNWSAAAVAWEQSDRTSQS